MTPARCRLYEIPAEYLKPLGYRSYIRASGTCASSRQSGVGFDHSYTLLDEDRYFTPRRLELDGEPCRSPGSKITIIHHCDFGLCGPIPARTRPGSRARPFLMYLAPHSPHFPCRRRGGHRTISRPLRGRLGRGAPPQTRAHAEHGDRELSAGPIGTDMWTRWNTPDEELFAKIGSGEVTRAVPWQSLTAEQKSFQRTKMASMPR